MISIQSHATVIMLQQNFTLYIPVVGTST